MAAGTVMAEEDLFGSLRRQSDPEKLEKQAKAVAEREASCSAKAEERLKYLLDDNSTLPISVSSIQLVGASHTRRSFLDKLFTPLLSCNRDAPYTLSTALHEIGILSDKLSRFGIFQPEISTFLDRSDLGPASSPLTHIDIYLKARERGRLSLKTGTDLGNAEGSAYGNLTWRNVFGGAESLNLNASAGTRTRSAYQATFDSPLFSDPDQQLSLNVLASSTHKPWASHEEVLKEICAKYSWASNYGTRHQLGYTGAWRQITSLAAEASPTLRCEAGDSVKSSITHTIVKDNRDNHLLPTRGYYLKMLTEIAGWGPLQGDVAFWKSEIESTGALLLPVPGKMSDIGITLTGGLRAGLLYPLPVGFGKEAIKTRINDRFQLGGPTDVRGFKLSGLGPQDGEDSVGGDVYAAVSTNLLFPLPRAGKDSPLRLQVFANAGRLLALSDSASKDELGQKNVCRDVRDTLAELGNGLPSIAAGVGMVYAHPVARFELNFSLPLVARKGEKGRKGLQFGVGINFL